MSKEYTEELLLDFGEDGNSLIPVVTQDINTKEVLILAFANKQAFDETRKKRLCNLLEPQQGGALEKKD